MIFLIFVLGFLIVFQSVVLNMKWPFSYPCNIPVYVLLPIIIVSAGMVVVDIKIVRNITCSFIILLSFTKNRILAWLFLLSRDAFFMVLSSVFCCMIL